MTKRERKKKAIEVAAEPEILETRGKVQRLQGRPVKIPRYDFTHKCPKCGSVRSKLRYTEPMPDGEGRDEVRVCKKCLFKWKHYRPNWPKD